MSGFTNITGFAPPTSIAGFMGLLQTASFRGVPFKVVQARVKKGRRWAIHEYPYVDGGWPEDMGRSLRTYAFSGYLIGDLAPVMQLLLDNAIETKGPGLLIHPTIGALQVGLLSSSTAVHRDHMRVIEVEFEFVEVGSSIFPLTIIATVVSVLAAADSALTASGTSLAATALPAAALGPAVTGKAQTVVTSFAAAATLGGANPTAIAGMAAALPPPDANTSYGRYGAGSASEMLPAGTTVASLQARLANQRAALAQSAIGAAAAAGSYAAGTDMLGALAALVEAMRAGITDPAGQVRVLLALAGFTFRDGAGGPISLSDGAAPSRDAAGIGAGMAAMRDAMAAACRRAALISLARASASYQPTSYDDAAALRSVLSAALDTEITAAGDAGEDAAYGALKTLRAAVVQDLTVRGASLPSIVTVVLGVPMPALAVAQLLYRDASRSDEIIVRSGAIHPAFCPISFRALASGMAAGVNPVLPPVVSGGAGTVLIAPASTVGAYQLPPPGMALNLEVAGTTSSAAALSWSAATAGGLASNYVVQVSAHGAGVWTTAGSVAAPSTNFTATGLASNTAYDFQVMASNASGIGTASAIATGTTEANAPNAPADVTASVGSPAASVVVLTWTASVVDRTHDAAASYTVQFQLAPGGGWVSFGAPVAGTSVSVTGLAHSTAFNFQVIAGNSGGTATSATVSATTLAAPPNVPGGLAAGTLLAITTSSIALSWAAPVTDASHDAASSYTLRYRVTSVGGGWTQITGIAGTTQTVTGLASATGYDFQVEAVNSGGASGFTATANGTTYAATIVLNYVSPSPFAHGGYPGVNATVTPTPANVREAWGSSATVEPTAGWTNGSNYSGSLWGCYLGGGASAGAGVAWLWLEAQNSNGATIGLSVTGPYTVT